MTRDETAALSASARGQDGELRMAITERDAQMTASTDEPKVALVTGAASGIGAGIARRLAGDGHIVCIIDRDEAGGIELATELADAGSTAEFISADVTDLDGLRSALDVALAKIGAPTILVNNAGFAIDRPFEDMDVEDWDAVQQVHLRAAYYLCRYVTGPMRAARWGRIVNISSISANGHPGRASYCAAKAGLEGLTRALAAELGPDGITVNAIAPGLVVTRMTHATAARRGLSLEDHLADATSRIPVRRAGLPADIAHAVSWFVSENAGFTTGQTLTVSGGVLI